MEIGIDSFAAAPFDNETGVAISGVDAISQLLERMEKADQAGLDIFGIGEHHRKDFLDSAPSLILAAAAARTSRIRLTSAVTVLSAADPVRVFQNAATLDLISNGRSEMVVGRGSFSESFPLFGFNFQDYDQLFDEKLGLLLNIIDNEFVHWSGKFRPALTGQGVYPRPVQQPLPVWIGVGGTPASFVRAIDASGIRKTWPIIIEQGHHRNDITAIPWVVEHRLRAFRNITQKVTVAVIAHGGNADG